jgi:hypothetical protein
MNTLLLPSSIQRIRSFLVEMCGMKVKPWASTEETLGALATTLVARHRCGIFWTSLRVLLETLARDLKTRAEALPGTLVDNEVLDGGRYADLLDEIRACLARQQGEGATASFRCLAATLSTPALALLLLLGGAATIGCDHAGLNFAPKAPDAAVLADANAAQPDTRRDTSTVIALPDTAPDTRPDSPPFILLDTARAAPDTAPGPDAATTGPDGATVTIQDIMGSCNVPSQDQAAVLACLARLRESWKTGMAEALAGAPCTIVNSELSCFAYASTTCMSGSAADFVVGSTRICQPILIYLGVRFI